jgi:hypothetical protein
MFFLGPLFGRFISREHLFSHYIYVLRGPHICSGESRTIIILRGILGALLIVAIPVFSVIVLVIEPVYETGLTPFKGMKSHGLPQDFRPSDQPVWNVIVVGYRTPLSMGVFVDRFFIDTEKIVG